MTDKLTAADLGLGKSKSKRKKKGKVKSSIYIVRSWEGFCGHQHGTLGHAINCGATKRNPRIFKVEDGQEKIV
jgi:hypothetical protein